MASRNKETKSSEVTAARPFLAAHGINQTDWTRLSRSSGARLEDFEVLSWPFVNLNAFLNVTGIQRRRRDTLFIMTFARSGPSWQWSRLWHCRYRAQSHYYHPCFWILRSCKNPARSPFAAICSLRVNSWRTCYERVAWQWSFQSKSMR